MLGSLPIQKLYLVDSFKPYDDYGAKYFTAKEQRGEYAKLIKNVNDYSHKTIIIKETSVWARQLFTEPFLHFVYIDGNHDYKNVKRDLKWWDLLVPDGIIGGHDYGGCWGDSVERAVNEFVAKKGVELNVLNSSRGGIEWAIIKK